MKTPTRLFDFVYYQKNHNPLKKSMGRRGADGKWIFYSTGELIDMAERAASGLLDLGLEKGDRIAISSYKNRPEWIIMDLAAQMAGMVSVTLYPTISPREYEFILNDSQCKLAFCGANDLYEKLKKAQPNVPSLQEIYKFDKEGDLPYWQTIFSEKNKGQVEKIKEAAKAEELATIIYTSGTTGNPKGVMLSHNNITYVVNETSKLLPVNAGENTLSFLPLCHIFERAVAYSYLYKSASTHFTGTDNLSGPTGDLANVQPYFFSTVPRLLEKVYEAIYNKGLQLTGFKKKLFFWALSLTDNYDINKGTSGFNWKIADKLIFSKWRAALGGNVRGIVTGAAPCPVKIMQVFNAAGIPVREGYGLTETSPTLTVNTYEKNGAMLGSVGPVLKGVEIKIDTSDGDYRPGEGEILAHGPNVMMGYYNNPEANAKVFKEMGGKRWFCTGDIGKFVDGPGGKQFLKITDRKKELLKTSGGKYVAPAPIEGRMKEDFLIEQMMVVGDKKKFVSALIVPSEEALKNWCKDHNVEWKGLDEMCKHDDVCNCYQDIINKYNPDFSHIEQVKKFKLISKQWLPNHPDGSDAELTPTLKLKRRVITEKFSKEIDEMYNV
ncbi:MAG: long-chain fatty acid--CoA ligase [Bacteroidota bacterium]